ncbi:unnamed protein product [Gordionus sp. m RMFG-2023]
MIYSIWCLLILINYNVLRGCEIKTFLSGILEDRGINSDDLFLISEHEAGSMNKDYITFKDCNGKLNLYSGMDDGFSFINPLIVLLNTTENGRGIMNRKYRLNSNGNNDTIKGSRIGNKQNNIFIHWRNYS